MIAATLHPEQAPPRDSVLPYLYTAPVALVVAGGMLAYSGPLALATQWSAPTLAITHVATLGFLSMIAVGVFMPLVAVAGNAAVPRPMTAHVVYYALVLGLACLTYGTARAEAAPVFAAIGAVAVMGVVFVWHGIVCLRRAEARGPTVRALRTALWSFALAASLGLWLAHGHGGMQFPGPRGLWLTVHLSVALLGWIGGVGVAATAEVLPARTGGAIVDERVLRWIDRGIGLGVTLPVVVLLAQYFGVIPAEAGWLRWVIGAAIGPALVAVWIMHPFVTYRALAMAEDGGGLRLMRLGLGLAPAAFVCGVIAMFSDDPRYGILFGWLAIVGWAGSCLYAVLVLVLPAVLTPVAPPSAGTRVETLLRRGFALHLAVLVAGVSAILVPRTGAAARVAGVLLVADGCVLLLAIARSRHPKKAVHRAAQ